MSDRRYKIVLAFAAMPVLLLLLVAGCSKNNSAAPAPGGQSGVGATSVSGAAGGSGAQLYASGGCQGCHGQIGAQGGGRAPNLTHEGSQPGHDAAWIAEQIKNPRSHNPSSRMPGYSGRMSDSDIQTLAAYIASQK